MGIVIVILTVLLVITALLLIGIVLIQPSKSGGGLGSMGGGITESVFGAGAGNVLTKTTVVLSTVFMVLTLVLFLLNKNRHVGVDIPGLPVATQTTVPAKGATIPAKPAEAPAVPAAPAAPAKPAAAP